MALSNKSPQRLLFIFALLLFMTHDFPVVGYLTPAAMYGGMVVFVHFATINFLGGSVYAYYWKQTFPLTLITWLCIFCKMFSSLTDAFIAFYGYLQIVIYFIIGLYIMKSKDYQLAKILAIFLLVYYSVTALTTYIGLGVFPGASRDMARMIEDEMLYGNYMKMNIGNFSFIYRLVLLIVILMLVFKNRLINPIISLALLFLFSLTIIRSEYTYAIILIFLGFLLIIVPQNFNVARFRELFFIAIVVLISIWSLLPYFLSYLSQVIGGGEASMRLSEVSNALDAGTVNIVNDASDLNIRIFYYQRSINAIVNTFPIGTWNLNETGGHSYILMHIACFGLLGLICGCYQFVRMFKLFIKPSYKSGWEGYFYFLFFEMILLALINPQLFTIVVAFYIPIIHVILEHKEHKYNNVIKF